jgi:hypothetical protein
VSKAIVSRIPSFKKRTIIGCFLITGWTLIALIAATAFGLVAYGSVKYLFWLTPIIPPILMLLFSNSTPPEIDKQDEKRAIMAIVITFACLVIVFLAGILKGNI